MRIGVVLPHMGDGCGPAMLLEAARRAEALGYDGLWAAERLLYPTEPRSRYPASPDGSLPRLYASVLTPLETLAFVAPVTSRIGLGTCILQMPLHNPVMLARQLATLDVLAGGRLRVGLGQGWSVDEYNAAGAAAGERGARVDEFVEVLKRVWTTDPAEFAGRFFTLPRSILQPKPVRRPHPPIYLAGYVPAALDRAGRLADGWLPAGVSLAALGPMMARVRAAAASADRDPAAVELVMLAYVRLHDRPAGAGRPDFVGSLAEIAADIHRARDLGTTELVVSAGYSTGDLRFDEFRRVLEQLPPAIA